MTLSPPVLDDRRYDDIFRDLRRRISVYNPSWTDHNDSDPGITLLQLFAYMSESLLFRLNQIPETTQLVFLKLLDIKLRPAVPARTMLRFTTSLTSGVVVQSGTVAYSGKLPFRIADECVAWPVTALAVARIATEMPGAVASDLPGRQDDPEIYDQVMSRLQEITQKMRMLGKPIPEEMDTYAPAYLRDGQRGLLQFDGAIDQIMWVALLNEKPGHPPQWSNTVLAGKLSLGFELADTDPGIVEAQACSEGKKAGAMGEVIVEIGRPTFQAGRPQSIRYERIAITSDNTAGLSRSGVIQLQLPDFAKDLNGLAVDPVYEGTDDWPPPLEPDEATRLWLWLRLRRRDGVMPALKQIAANAGLAAQALRHEIEFLGVGTGQPGQRFRLSNGPVVVGDPTLAIEIEVETSGFWKRWDETPDVLIAPERAQVFSVDAEAGEICFGVEGPDMGERVRCLGYSSGGGVAGNVPIGAVSRIEASGDIKVTNMVEARGGADAEDLNMALLRLPGELRRRDRAVTAEDFQELALFTPGAELGRAECLPRFHPGLRKWAQPGIVSVMIWPQAFPPGGKPPIPDRTSIGLVCAYLSERRLVTTELYIVPPDYVEVAVSVKIAVENGFGIVAVSRWVEKLLRQFLSPLPPHGPEGQGWPLGRAVNPRELEAVVLQVQGVDFIEDLAVARRIGNQWIKQEMLQIEPQQVVWLSSVVAVGPGSALPAPGQEVAFSPPGIKPLPIPVIREIC